LFGFRVQGAYQNRGVGTRMLREVEDDLRAMNFKLITLNVSRENTEAIRLYERLGYRIVGNEPGQWSYINHLGKRVFVDEPSYRMEKHL
jgi:ribosomal protein S18 acetylase RimI-like enzyme